MTTVTFVQPAALSSRTSVATTGRPSTGSTGFGQCSVTGRRRVPSPAAITIAFTRRSRASAANETACAPHDAEPLAHACAQPRKLRTRARRCCRRVRRRAEAGGRECRRELFSVDRELRAQERRQLVRRETRVDADSLVGEEVTQVGAARRCLASRIGRRVPQVPTNRLRQRDECDREGKQEREELAEAAAAMLEPERSARRRLRGPDVRAGEGHVLVAEADVLVERCRVQARSCDTADDPRGRRGVELRGRHRIASREEAASRCRVKGQPSKPRKPDLDPCMRVMVGHRPRVRIAVVRAAHESLGHARGDAEVAQHERHRTGEVLAVAALRVEDEVGERIGSRLRRSCRVLEPAGAPEPRLERQGGAVRALRIAHDLPCLLEQRGVDVGDFEEQTHE